MKRILFLTAAGGLLLLGRARAQTFTYTTENSRTTITGVSGASGALTVPATLGGYNVTEIGRAAFKDQTAITSLTFAAPANVTRLGAGAFQGCTALQSVALPTGITAVPTGLLQGCTALTSVSIPTGVTGVGAAAFADCRSLASLSLPTGLTSLGESAFQNCRSLAALTVPGGVTTIPGQLCQECRALTSLSLPAGITQIGYGAFANCVGLGSLTLPTGVAAVTRDAFQGCSGLTTLALNGSLASVGERALLGANKLGTVTVDSANPTFSSLDGVLFNKAQTSLLLCPAGRSGNYAVPAGTTGIGAAAFAHCSGLLTVTFPTSVTTLGDDALYYASGLTRLALPEGVTSLGAWAVAGCSRLPGVTIPASVVSLGSDAFHYDRGLAYALFNGNAPTMGTSVFDGAASPFTVYYYAGRTGFSAPTWLGYPASELGTPPALVAYLTQYGFSPGTSALADPNNDGVNFLTAYALGLDPTANLAGSLPRPTLGTNTLGLTFKGNSAGVSYTVQTSGDLQTWTSSGVTVSDPDGSGQRTATVPLTAGEPTRFLRLVVGY